MSKSDEMDSYSPSKNINKKRSKYQNDEYGVWKVLGINLQTNRHKSEDRKEIGYIEGTYGEILAFAESLDNWYGSEFNIGTGKIEKIDVLNIASDIFQKIIEVSKKKTQKENELKIIESEYEQYLGEMYDQSKRIVG